MTCLDCQETPDRAKVAVFLKGEPQHVDDLIDFLGNQDIACSRFPEEDQCHMEELSFFDDGFYVTTTAERWSFYELRNYIQTYANTWENDYVMQHSLVQNLLTCDENISFDDAFYVQIAKQIDSCEDRYYMAGKKISQFFDGIQKLLCNNLKLYWVATELADYTSQNLRYLSHVPAKLPKHDISLKISGGDDQNIIQKEIEFNGETMARIHLCPGPFSPKLKLISEFVDYLILHIDDFVYGIISHRREVQELKDKLSALSNDPAIRTEEEERRERQNMRILLLGSLQTSAERARSIFKEYGFHDVKMITDWNKIKGHDANNLLKHRGRYDALFIGPVPHKIKNAGNILSKIESEPERYPPHIVLRNFSKNLKITKNALENGLQQLIPKLEPPCCSPYS